MSENLEGILKNLKRYKHSVYTMELVMSSNGKIKREYTLETPISFYHYTGFKQMLDCTKKCDSKVRVYLKDILEYQII